MRKLIESSHDVSQILSRFPVDSIRYYLCASTTYGSDLNFSEDSLVTMHNSELADALGNLVHRVLNLMQKYCNGVVPETTHDPAFALPFDLAALKSHVREDMKSCALHLALFKAMEAVRATNRFLTEAEPWKLKGADEARRIPIVRTALEAIYAFSHFLAPVLPLATQTIFTKIGVAPVSAHNLRDDFYNIPVGTVVTLGEILFQKIEVAIPEPSAVDVKATAGKPKPGKAGKNAVEEEEVHEIDFTKVDFRVGRITKVWNHETADRLYCEEIDVGAEAGGVRPVVSGLRSYYSLEEMQDRLVIVVCNLKESKFQGVMSFGMVLAAKSADGSRVEILSVPEGSVVGERLTLQGYIGAYPAPLNAARMKKLKAWEGVAPDLHTDESGVACWKELQLCTSAGVCSVATLASSPIS